MGLSDWENFQPHALWALFTTSLVNSKDVYDQERMISCRHSSVAANVIYQEADSTSEANKFAALGIFPKKNCWHLKQNSRRRLCLNLPKKIGIVYPKKYYGK